METWPDIFHNLHIRGLICQPHTDSITCSNYMEIQKDSKWTEFLSCNIHDPCGNYEDYFTVMIIMVTTLRLTILSNSLKKRSYPDTNNTCNMHFSTRCLHLSMGCTARDQSSSHMIIISRKQRLETRRCMGFTFHEFNKANMTAES